MAIKLNEAGFEHAKELIKGGLEVEKKACDWNAHKATEDEIDKFLETHYMAEYGLWFLGINTDMSENAKERYVFPYGDFKIVHKSAIIIAEEDAARKGAREVQHAAKQLLELINKAK